ncbi:MULTISPECIES: aldo/keto reductase [Pseudoxanthomonas]|uniref:D-threo-aldose 1-dehydrogenase n=1 Tax=Pseudoxanthomonas winnipegensis TaxID=2480810 RepID=A0AAW8GIW0_9GAMM|nr:MULTISPECIES: aldo/keto reductase [Pseudoxanthomonas]MDQ1120993.1 D-threo-aldose 1-dehydrogenase [Pseudoxanthomonas winnipegensis]MDQ1134223.1 D-threo-aldose 1-dehydrogenase [Pseudoxanthomonas winnipegensis]MDR6139543.1 D-threo-aldose 1-dehydrogenase [Pseudoxanthomonas sp. SORGH_AS_0997]
MLHRRRFLTAAAAGTAALAASPLLAQSTAPGPGSVLPTKGRGTGAPLPSNAPRSGRFRPSSRLGLGGVAIGNGFAPATDAQSEQTLAAAWAAGVRYFDTSPWYGLGLSERRFGHHLHTHPADQYVLSTKVGRLLTATAGPLQETMWQSPSPFRYRYDYSAAGTRRSVEDSLNRLGVAQLDVVFIHDLSPDNEDDLGMPWEQRFAEAAKGAMPELTRMREEGLIKAWGFGVNRPEPALRAIEQADPDIFLLACQYSLLDHAKTLHETFPKIAAHGASVVVGAPLLAGYLAGRDRYLYDGKMPDWAPAKRARVQAVCDRHGVDLRTVALQFANAPAVVSAVIPGARTPAQVQANVASMAVAVPQALWDELRHEGLIDADAPVPAAA